MKTRREAAIVLLSSFIILGASLSFVFLAAPQAVHANSAEITYPGGTATTIAPVQDSSIVVKGENLSIDLGSTEAIWKEGKATISASYDLRDEGDAARTSTFAFPLLASYEDLHKEEALPSVSFAEAGAQMEKKPITKILYIGRIVNSDEELEYQLRDKTLGQMIDEYNDNLKAIPGVGDTFYHYRYSLTLSDVSSLRFADLYFKTKTNDGIIYQGETGTLYTNLKDHTETIARYAFLGEEKTFAVDFYSNRLVETAEWFTEDENGLSEQYDAAPQSYEAEATWAELFASATAKRSLDADWLAFKLAELGLGNRTRVINFTSYQPETNENYYQYLAFLIYKVDFGGQGKEYGMEVSYPLTPSRHGEYNPICYRINYVLTPAKLWKSFSNFNIRVIGSDGYLVHSSHAFAKTDEGWKNADENPSIDINLEFDYCESANPVFVSRGDIILSAFVMTVVGILFLVCPAFMAGASPWIFGAVSINVIAGILIFFALISGLVALIVVAVKRPPDPPKR